MAIPLIYIQATTYAFAKGSMAAKDFGCQRMYSYQGSFGYQTSSIVKSNNCRYVQKRIPFAFNILITIMVVFAKTTLG